MNYPWRWRTRRAGHLFSARFDDCASARRWANSGARAAASASKIAVADRQSPIEVVQRVVEESPGNWLAELRLTRDAHGRRVAP